MGLKRVTEALCARVGMSRQNFYKGRQQRQRRRVDGDLVAELVRAERAVQPRLGGRKLYHLLKEELVAAGVRMGRDLFFEVLDVQGLLVEALPKAPRTTDSRHCLPIFTNRLKDLEVTGPNQAWVSDITYLRTQEGFLYLSLITDKYSRKIVGYHAGDTLETQGCLAALDRAVKELTDGAFPLHHSDRGCQYCSHEYVKQLQAYGLGISMTEDQHCAENALAERVNGILKQEYWLGSYFRTKRQALAAVEQAIELYNTRRPHQALGFKTPAEVHRPAA